MSSRPTRNSCAKARRSPTSSIPTASWSEPRTSTRAEVLREIYRPLFLNQAPILFTGRRTAELTKYAANAFLAVKISFINEIADLCEAVDADVQDVARGIGLDNRIGPKFLHAGPGYGGSCFPKDTLALLQTATKPASSSGSSRTVVEVNDDRKAAMADRVAKALGGNVGGKRIGVLGLAFKPNTDDMRDAPSIPLIKALVEQGARSRPSTRSAREQAEQMFPGSTSPTTPMRPPKVRMRWSSSPSGTSSARSTSTRSPSRCAARCWSTCATSTTAKSRRGRTDLFRGRPRARLRQGRRSGHHGRIALSGSGGHETCAEIVVIGLGYVGLPLAVALARTFEVDRASTSTRSASPSCARADDRTREVDESELQLIHAQADRRCGAIARGADVYIVTVPTPVDAANRPDLGAVLAATRTIARLIDPARRPTIIYESTVYPGRDRRDLRAGDRACRRPHARPRFPPRLQPGADQSRRPRTSHRQDHEGDRRRGRGGRSSSSRISTVR